MAESKSPKDSHEAEDETKRKFREALDRKIAKSSGGSDHKDSGGKQSRVHGPAESRREFRRKSG
ncbi:DUF5302 domain-containing protein [Mycobacterium sp.]|uniref:DUF5302 domain-containing protein n=1 Tax=Mycobacterium sp. TaxID=1785 RepID=UPI003F9A201C